jgi:pyruvate dehydrogenase E1 component beta subunit
MAVDPSIFVVGEGIGKRGGNFNTTLGLYDIHGPERLRDTPIVERGFVGMAAGAAMTGSRPVVDFMFFDFILDSIGEMVNQIAKMRYMSGGTVKVPLVMRAPVGATGRGAQHAQNPEAILFGVPGIKIICPATAYDAKGMLKAAIRDENPVLMFEHKLLYGSKGARAESGAVDASSELPEGDFEVPIGKGVVGGREGRDADRDAADDAPVPSGGGPTGGRRDQRRSH